MNEADETIPQFVSLTGIEYIPCDESLFIFQVLTSIFYNQRESYITDPIGLEFDIKIGIRI